MKIHLFREMFALNEEFDHVIRGLGRMEKAPTYQKEMIRWARAHVESAQVEANRQFFDEFDAIVENDAIGAYKFLRDHKKRITDPDDIYLEIKNREEARKAKRLPPRLVILPDWDLNDEQRYDKAQSKKRKRAPNRHRKTTKKLPPKVTKAQLSSIANPRTVAKTPREEGTKQ